jgi:periplasmic protein TonB
MHALEDEPETGGRWRRLLGGAGVAAGILGLMAFGATQYEPSRKLIERVVEMTVVDEKPKPIPAPPKKFLPPPPPKKAPPPQKAAMPQQAQPKQANANPNPQVGLDTSSFSGEGSGPSFAQGDYSMGDPMKVGGGSKVKDVPVVATKPRGPGKVVEPRVVKQGRLPPYPKRARELGIEGMVVIEVSIDERGKLTHARVRAGIDPELDRQALASVREWEFEPGTRDGQRIKSTRFVRVRFKLEG